MAKLAYENDIIAALGPISGMHKLLYLTLWSRANEIGHIMVNLDDILGLTGIRFQHEDLTHFGDRLVMVDKNEAILSRYLLTTIGTFSKGMRGQKKMWDLMKIRWGATKDDITPFMEGWKKLGILRYAPEFPGEYTGEESLPDWLVAHRKELEKVSSMDTPFGWPTEVAKMFKRFILHRVKVAREQTSRSLAMDHRITTDQVILFQEMVQEMIYNGVKESKIVDQIRYPIANNKKTFYLP